MPRCSNYHDMPDEEPGTLFDQRRPCPQCGSKDRLLALNLHEELIAMDDPYNTVVEDSAAGRKVEEVCRLIYQRKLRAPNPGNVKYPKILKELKNDFTVEQHLDLQAIATVTDNLAHGNGFGAKVQFEKLCARKNIALPTNDIVKGAGIISLRDIMNLVDNWCTGEAGPVEPTKDSDMFEGNLVWTRTCREAYLRLCAAIKKFAEEKLQSLEKT